jgi:DNA-binding response OmpR family regulator
MAKTPVKAHILVVDDERRLVGLLRHNLESVGYSVSTAADGTTALALVESQELDLVILDLMLPDVDGYEVCRQIREYSDVPIIMLTARSDQSEKVRGLDLGADDYLTKPFDAKEMLARVRAVLRRTKVPQQSKKQPILVADDLVIDFARRQVSVRGERIKLSPTEYKLLYELASNADRVLLHDELLRRVWGSEYRDEVEYLRVYIRYLRQKLEPDPAKPRYILTEPGVGYLFATPKVI